MGSVLRGSILCVVAILCFDGAQAEDSDMESLREAIDELRAEYEARITALEQRLEQAERKSASARSAVAPPVTAPRGAGSTSAFNPAIGVIFQGQVWDHKTDPESYVIQGFPLGGEAGPISSGLAIGETEIDISANVDDKFTAWLTVPVVIEDGEAGVEIEEAWLETTALPAGFAARFGRFFSNIGYLNSKHAHAWDFADQPLPYQVFLGDQYLDDGVQLRWVAPTDLFVEVGAEVFRGSRFPAAGAEHAGLGARSLFVNIGGDAGRDHSWLAGVSHLRAEAVDRTSGDGEDPLSFSGDSDTTIAQFVWKWARNGNWKDRNLIVQGEMFWNTDRGVYTLPGGLPLDYDDDRRGWYVQAVHQPWPRWRFGARIDSLSQGPAFAGSALDAMDDDPLRYSLMADWSNSEFSRLRVQFSRDEFGVKNGHQWGLQYIMSIGAHGAHSF